MWSCHRAGVWSMGALRTARVLGSGVCAGLGEAAGSPGPRAMQQQQHLQGEAAIASVSLGDSWQQCCCLPQCKSCQCPLQSQPLGSMSTNTVGSSAVKYSGSPWLLWGPWRSSTAEDDGSSTEQATGNHDGTSHVTDIEPPFFVPSCLLMSQQTPSPQQSFLCSYSPLLLHHVPTGSFAGCFHL